MPRHRDILREYKKLSSQLQIERQQIRSRLLELHHALGPDTVPSAPAKPSVRRGRPPENKIGMREAIQQATASRALGVRDIVDAMQHLGFRFKSKNPYNSVGAYLYGPEGKKHFKKANGGFRPK